MVFYNYGFAAAHTLSKYRQRVGDSIKNINYRVVQYVKLLFTWRVNDSLNLINDYYIC